MPRSSCSLFQKTNALVETEIKRFISKPANSQACMGDTPHTHSDADLKFGTSFHPLKSVWL